MYCRHKPSKCKEQGKLKNDQRQNANGSNKTKPSQNAKGGTPKLKLNNKLAAPWQPSIAHCNLQQHTETSLGPDFQ
jgi:hypothetical protein